MIKIEFCQFKCQKVFSLPFSHIGIIFFFKQKTAYEIDMDWSSDVCSSDLSSPRRTAERCGPSTTSHHSANSATPSEMRTCIYSRRIPRSEERRVGKECRARWPALNNDKN